MSDQGNLRRISTSPSYRSVLTLGLVGGGEFKDQQLCYIKDLYSSTHSWLYICFTAAISCTELLVIALSLVISLRLGFWRNIRSVSRISVSFFILETDRKFLRNPNLNEIISLHLYLCQHLNFYTFKFQTVVHLSCTYLISMISLIFILFSRIILLQSVVQTFFLLWFSYTQIWEFDRS